MYFIVEQQQIAIHPCLYISLSLLHLLCILLVFHAKKEKQEMNGECADI